MRLGSRNGQSLIESCFVIALIGLIFMGLFQISQLFGAWEVLQHAAARGARAKTVGFNWWMVEKAIRVASIPNAGNMLEPEVDTVDLNLRQLMAAATHPGALWDDAVDSASGSPQYAIERARIPDYMAAATHSQAHYILDYEDWDTVRSGHAGALLMPGAALSDSLRVSVEQHYPMVAPMHRVFYGADSVGLVGVSELENHYPLYIDDRNW